MKKYLYTDIDYVLSLGSEINAKYTKWGSIHRFNPGAVKVLNEILKITNADIIVSSDWKNHFSLKQLQEIFIEWAKIIKAPIDVTPDTSRITLERFDEFRATEILTHVKINKPDSWVAIDDINLSSWISEEHFVHLLRFMEGIKQSGKRDEIIKKLNAFIDIKL
jgi:HAD domain in Swiss Army Knife RNA repair proteins